MMMQNSDSPPILVYTDGSCHTQLHIGSWVAIIIIDGVKTILKGKDLNTTHNRMELTAVIKAIEYLKEKHFAHNTIQIITDSQYVAGLSARKEKLGAKNFTTKKGNDISNADLVKELLLNAASVKIEFVKIKAHQKSNPITNFNIEADKLSRQIVRQAVKEIS